MHHPAVKPPDLRKLSPAARAVYERVAAGTYQVDHERLAQRLLAEFRRPGLRSRPCREH
jgi:hypothetical protein